MAEEDNPNALSSIVATDDSSGSSGNDFCLLSEDDIVITGDLAVPTLDPSVPIHSLTSNVKSESSSAFGLSAPVDVEAIKRKAEELAKSLQKALSSVSKTVGSSSSLDSYEVRDDLKQHRERSLYVEQKLKEDRKLFEESKKRSEAVFDKVQSVKRIHESISENVRELNRKDNDDTNTLKLRIQSLEDTISRLQESLNNKNRIISEKNEQIRTLNQSVSDTHDAYMHSLEQSELEIGLVKTEYKRKIDEIASSKEELCNQLQLVRKNYLSVENNLKLSDFSRSRLVTKNAEMQEKIILLEKDNERLSMKMGEEGSSESQELQVKVDDIYSLRPKIENLVIVTNEFTAFLVDDLNDIEELPFDDNDDVSPTLDAIGDKLEAAFFTMRDKLSSMPKLQATLEKMDDELKHTDSLLRKNKREIIELQTQLSTLQLKLDEAIEEKTRLAEIIEFSRSGLRSVDDVNREIAEERDSPRGDIVDGSLEVEQLNREYLLLEEKLESKSKKIRALTSNVDSLQTTISNLQQERSQLLEEIDEKSNECENLRHGYNEVNAQLQSLREDSSHVSSEQFQQLAQEYELLQETCTELRFKYDSTKAELRAKCEQLEKASGQHLDEQFEKEENDFVVLQTRDCDEEDVGSLKRQYAQLRDENEKLLTSVRTLSEKAVEYENDCLIAQKYANECTRLQEVVKRLGQELDAAKRRLIDANVASRETEYDKDDEIEGLREEMAKLAQQLNQVWDQLHQEKTRNHCLCEQLSSYEKVKATMIAETQEYKMELEIMRRSNEELKERIHSLPETDIISVELNTLREHCSQLQNLFDQAQCEHQTTLNELQTLQNAFAQMQTAVSEVEDLKRYNHDLQKKISKLSQKSECLEASYNESVGLLANKDAELNAKTAEAQQSFQELHNTLTVLNETQCDLQSARKELEKAYADLEDSQVVIDKMQEELTSAQNHVKTMSARLNESETSTSKFMEKYNREMEVMHDNIAKLNCENLALEKQCEKHVTSYRNLQLYLSQLIDAARKTSDDAINIVFQLQSRWPIPKIIVDAEIQCNAELGASMQPESETYELLLEDMRNELTALQARHEELKQQLLQKDDECYTEINRYENLIKELRNELVIVQERLSSVELERRQQNEDYERYCGELNDRLQSSQAEHLFECEQYENRIKELRQKICEVNKPEVVDTGIQVTTYEKPHSVSEHVFSEEEHGLRFTDVNLVSNEESGGTNTDQVTAPQDDKGVASHGEGPGLMKYFGYYKEKMAKGLTEILNPEEETADYSNWILPDKPIVEHQRVTEAAVVPLVTETGQNSASHISRMSISDVLDRLQNVIITQISDSGWDVDENPEWNCSQLQINDPEFVSTAFKFVDLFDIIVQFYSSLPATDVFLERLSSIAMSIAPPPSSNITTAFELPKARITKLMDSSRETIEQIVTLTTLLENENKHLIDAVTFLEELIVTDAQPPQSIRFQSVIDYWRCRVAVDDDVIDRICEEYDIVPVKFVPGEQLVQWKEQIARCIELALMSPPLVLPAPEVVPVCSAPVADKLQVLKKKMHKLIVDLHYVYKDQQTFNPVDFFAQIEDINHSVETTVKIISSKDEKSATQTVGLTHLVPEEHHDEDDYHHDDHEHHDEDDHHHDDHEHHEHDLAHHIHNHGHHEYSHQQDHAFEHHRGHGTDDVHPHREPPDYQQESAHEHEQRDTVGDLKTLLGESNRKIDSLVKELMEVKSSREYNEVRQLHVKLDETLYQLHLRDVHVVELTRELTQLLAERDALQLKLSNIIRQNEQLRQTGVANMESSCDVQTPDLENKLEELHTVNYMRDPRISEASKQYHRSGMQLYNEEQKNKEESSASIVPSILKWFTGDTENK